MASVRGLEHWDWAVYSAEAELDATFQGLKDFPLKIFSEDIDDE